MPQMAVNPDVDSDHEPDPDPLDEPSKLLQKFPVWRAYNSLIGTATAESGDHPLDHSHSLPIINAPAHEWSTLVTVLENLYKLNEMTCPVNPGKVMVTFDMDLYKRALKLEYLDERYKGKWWLLPGAFHTSLCAVRCLGKTVEGSGIDESWFRSELYSEVVVNQIINGSHYNHAVEAHEITLQALTDLWLDEFFSELPAVRDALVSSTENLAEAFNMEDGEARKTAIREAHQKLLIEIESMNLEMQLQDFDRRRAMFPMYSWLRMYMHQVLALLNFHRSVKQPQLLLYLSSLENLATYFFAYNRLDYAQNILEFTARTYASETTDPDLWKRLCAGEFAVTKNPIPFTSIGIDQSQEHDNKILKGEGGLRGITNKPSTLLKFCLAAPVLGHLSKETQEMFGVTLAADSNQHHHHSAPRVACQEKNVQALKAVLQPHGIFSDQNKQLHNFMTKQVLRDEAQTSILNMEARGEAAKVSFVEQRICGKVNLWDRMTRVKFLNWDDLHKKTTLKSKTKEFQLRTTTSLFSRLLVIAKSDRNLDLQAAISQHEFHSVNHVLMRPDGTLLPCKGKSDLVKALLDACPQTKSEPVTNDNRYLIIDGMAVVQAIMHAAKFGFCRDLGKSFPELIDSLLQNYEGGRVVFDNYQREISIKDDIRYSKQPGHAEDLYVEDSTPINNVKKFLSSKTTKDRLTLYLAQKVIFFCKKPVVTVTREDVLTNVPEYHPTTGISSQEEADTLMVPHALELVNEKPGNKVDFFTKDTDCWVLILRRLPLLGPNTRIITGTGVNHRQIVLKPIYDQLGTERAEALPGFHAVTGCDTTGQISGVGKKGALKVFMKAPPQIIDALGQLGIGDVPSTEVIERCEEFYCMLLGTKEVSGSDAATLRWQRFKKLSPNQGVEKLPPTSGAWKQHTLRAHIQAKLWAQDTVLTPQIPDPCKLGWLREEGGLVPVLSQVQAAPEAVVELFWCNCGVSKCAGRCTCKAHNLACTELCKCEANEDCCNTHTVIGEEDI
jgi:hypothetical protein